MAALTYTHCTWKVGDGGDWWMKGTLQKYNTEVVPLADEGINVIEIYFDCLRTLHTQAVTEAISNYTPWSP